MSRLPIDTTELLKVAASLTQNQFAGFVKLIAHLWQSADCSLPLKRRQLVRMSGIREDSLSAVLELFDPHPDKPYFITHTETLKTFKAGISIARQNELKVRKRWDQAIPQYYHSITSPSDGDLFGPKCPKTDESSDTAVLPQHAVTTLPLHPLPVPVEVLVPFRVDKDPDPDPTPSFLTNPTVQPVRTQKTDQSRAPIWPGCEYFRMTAEEHELMKSWYEQHKYPTELLDYAIGEVDGWLGNGSKQGALKARNAQTHYRQLRAAWVVENAMKLHRVAQSPQNRPSNGYPQRETRHEKNMRILYGHSSGTETTGDDQRSVPDAHDHGQNGTALAQAPRTSPR